MLLAKTSKKRAQRAKNQHSPSAQATLWAAQLVSARSLTQPAGYVHSIIIRLFDRLFYSHRKNHKSTHSGRPQQKVKERTNSVLLIATLQLLSQPKGFSVK